MERVNIGVDIGGMTIKAGVVNNKGEILFRNTRKTNQKKGVENFINTIKEQIDELNKIAIENNYTVCGVGFGIPGVVNNKLGTIDYACNLGFEYVPLKEKLKDLNLEIGSDIFDEFLTKIGYKDFLESKDETKDKVENIKALIDDIRAFIKRNPESSLLEYLQNVTLITSQDEINEEDNVSLMTVHTAKGLEFNYVFIIGFNENIFHNQIFSCA